MRNWSVTEGGFGRVDKTNAHLVRMDEGEEGGCKPVAEETWCCV